jgi:hypothetical protein
MWPPSSWAISATNSLLPIPGGPHKKSGRFLANAFNKLLRACTEVTVLVSDMAVSLFVFKVNEIYYYTAIILNSKFQVNLDILGSKI